MTDAINSAGADQQVQSYVDRCIRLREEADERMADVAEVLKEAKGLGFDKAAIKGLVAEKRARAKKGDAIDEAATILDLYRAAYERAVSRMHTREAA